MITACVFFFVSELVFTHSFIIAIAFHANLVPANEEKQKHKLLTAVLTATQYSRKENKIPLPADVRGHKSCLCQSTFPKIQLQSTQTIIYYKCTNG